MIQLYTELVKSRLVEEKMLVLLRQGKISKWFSGIGQEAISIGASLAVGEEAYLLPAHRNLGVFTTRGISIRQLIAQFQGKEEGFTKGRDRSFHFGSHQHKIIGMISHLAAQLPVADGIALADQLDGRQEVTVVFTGEGGTSEGDFHEALNLAAVWELPVIFVIENNAYSISTPIAEQFKIKSFKEKADAYGIEVLSVDGNNILEMYHTVKAAATTIKEKSQPILIEANTFRMRGHEESANNDFVPQTLLEQWAKRDPLENYEEFLLNEGLITQQEISEIYQTLDLEVKSAAGAAEKTTTPSYNSEKELRDVYAPANTVSIAPDLSHTHHIRLIDAVNEALDQSMYRHHNLILMGQDIAEFGGVFKATAGLAKKYGKTRVRNTPLCESAVLGAGLGLSIKGYKSVIEMQFSDFVTCGFNQIVNNLAKSHYRWGQQADVVIRMPSGAGVSAGPFHSQSTEAWFYRVAGLKIVYPSNPFTAKGLLNAAINDPNPVLFFEHKKMYRSTEQQVPKDYYTIDIGKARIAKSGDDISIITYGMGVLWAEKAQKALPDVSLEIIDLQTLLPWDKEAVIASVKNTGKALVLTEDSAQGSIINDVATHISQQCFQVMDAPVMTLGSADHPIPFHKSLEDGFLAESKLIQTINELMEY